MTHVYVIQAEGGPVKIGVARDPGRRLAALQTATHVALRLEHAEPVDEGLDVLAVEKAAHRLLDAARVQGEWFDVTAAAAREAIRAAISQQVPFPADFVIISDITSEQVRAARMLLRWEQKDLSAASGVSLPTIKRLEAKPGVMSAQGNTIRSLQRALEAAGIEFIPENGGGPGVRIRKTG